MPTTASINIAPRKPLLSRQLRKSGRATGIASTLRRGRGPPMRNPDRPELEHDTLLLQRPDTQRSALAARNWDIDIHGLTPGALRSMFERFTRLECRRPHRLPGT